MLLRLGNFAWPSLNAKWDRIYSKFSRITLWAFDLNLGRGVSPNFQPRRVSLKLTLHYKIQCYKRRLIGRAPVYPPKQTENNNIKHLLGANMFYVVFFQSTYYYIYTKRGSQSLYFILTNKLSELIIFKVALSISPQVFFSLEPEY